MLKVAAAATLEPEMAPNTPLEAITTEARPPGSQPSHLSSAEKRRFTAPLPENTAPMKMKSGMASSVNELSDSHAVQAICTSGLSTANTNPTAATRPIATPISSPKASSRSSPPMSRPARSSGLSLELLGAEPAGGTACPQVLDRLDELREHDQSEQREADRQRHLRPLEGRSQHGIRSHVARERIAEQFPAHPRRDREDHQPEGQGCEPGPSRGARTQPLDDERDADVAPLHGAVGEAEAAERDQRITAELVRQDQRIPQHVAGHHLGHGQRDDGEQDQRGEVAGRVRKLPGYAREHPAISKPFP